MNIYKLFRYFQLKYFLVFCKYVSLYIKEKPPEINKIKLETSSSCFFLNSVVC